MAKKAKATTTPAVRSSAKAPVAAPPDPLAKERTTVRTLLQKDPTGRSVHDELVAAVKSRAEAIWRQSGCTHGHQEADWRQAREELGIPPNVVV